jgi:hypothetical protein
VAPQELKQLRAIRHSCVSNLRALHFHAALRRLQVPAGVAAPIAPTFTSLVALPTDEVALLCLKRFLHDQAQGPTHQLAQRPLAVLHSLELPHELPQLFPHPLTRRYLTHGGVNSFLLTLSSEVSLTPEGYFTPPDFADNLGHHLRISRFADGKMVEMWRNENVLPVLIAMGLFPAFPEFTVGDGEF